MKNKIISAKEARIACKDQISEIHKGVNKCIIESVMPCIKEKIKFNLLGFYYLPYKFLEYYNVEDSDSFDFKNPNNYAFYLYFKKKLEDLGYTCEFPDVSAVVGNDFMGEELPYVMGIKDVIYSDLNDGDWSEGWVVHKIKSYEDLIIGEHLGNYGLNIRNIE